MCENLNDNSAVQGLTEVFSTLEYSCVSVVHIHNIIVTLGALILNTLSIQCKLNLINQFSYKPRKCFYFMI